MSIVVPLDMEELPSVAVPYWAPTAKGWFVNAPTLFGNAQVKTSKTPEVLPEFKEMFRFNGQRLPRYIISQAHDFFRQVWEKQKTESSAYICHHPVTGDFKLFIPEQYVSGTSVNHKLDVGQIRKGYQAIGTIHSHCNFSAFHSGTDKHDMGKMPGIHITLGHVDQDNPEIAIALSILDARFDPVAYDSIIDDEKPKSRHGYDTAPEQWLRFVHTGSAPWNTGGVTTSYRQPGKVTNFRTPYSARNQRTPTPWDADDEVWGVPYVGGYQQQAWYYGSDDKVPEWRKRQIAEQKQADDAFKTFGEEVDLALAECEFLKQRLCLYGFVLNFSVIHNPDRADTYYATHGTYTEAELLDYHDDPLLPGEAIGEEETEDA